MQAMRASQFASWKSGIDAVTDDAEEPVVAAGSIDLGADIGTPRARSADEPAQVDDRDH